MTNLFLDLIDLLDVLVKDVLANEIGSLELLPGQRAQPLVFRQFFRISLPEDVEYKQHFKLSF